MKNSRVGPFAGVVSAFVVATLAPGALAMAQTPREASLSRRVTFDIPAQPLPVALAQFSAQAGLEFSASTDLVEGKQGREVKGMLTTDEGLRALLRGTGLEFTALSGGVVAIRAIPSAQAQSDGATALRLAQAEASQQDGARPQGAEGQGEDKVAEVRVVGKPFTDANVDIVRTENDVQPYYILKGQEIAEASAVTISDYLKQRLSMDATASMDADYSGRANYSEINLRGLGLDQTLILVNGRRVAANEPKSLFAQAPQFDLNSLDPAMIDRIEILPSSASAIYGGSAVGGVVNVVLKRDFVGGGFRLAYDTPMDVHAPVRAITGAYGWSFEDGRTHLTISASYRDTESVLLGDRPEIVGRGEARLLERSPGLLYGPGVAYYGGGGASISSYDGSDLTLKGGGSLNSPLTYVPLGTTPETSPEDLRAGLLANAGQQVPLLPSDSRHPFSRNSLTPPLEAKSVNGAIRRKMTDRLELMVEAFYNSNDNVFDQYSNLYNKYYLPSSPVNPFEQIVMLGGALPIKTTQANKHESKRVVGGFVLDLPADWRAQGDYTWNRSESYFSGYAAGLAPGSTFDADRQSGALNLFVDWSDPANHDLMAPYLTPQDVVVMKSAVSLNDTGLRMSGPVGSLPAGRPNLTIGLGHREERLLRGLQDTGMYGRNTYLPQSQRIASAYAEGLVPLIGPGNAVPGVHRLDLQAAARLERFSVSSRSEYRYTVPPDYTPNPDEVLTSEKVRYSATNTTVGLRYQPVEALTFRASYATAFLPPGFADLLPGVVDPFLFSLVSDPQRGGELRTVTFRRGGNPDLDPLDARTWTVGLIFEPEALEGMRVGLEWFRISRSNLPFAPSAVQILDEESQFPERVVRAQPEPGDPYGVGPITFIDLSLLSAKRVSTQGFDFSIGYRRPTERYGTFNVELLGTVVDKFTRVLSLDGESEDVVNQIWNGGPLELRANAMLGWERGSWRMSWVSMYYGAYDQDTYAPVLTAQGSKSIPSQLYHDFLLGYRFGALEGSAHALSGLDLTLGIRNVFNGLAPFDASGGQAYMSPFGDYRRRSIQLAVAKRF